VGEWGGCRGSAAEIAGFVRISGVGAAPAAGVGAACFFSVGGMKTTHALRTVPSNQSTLHRRAAADAVGSSRWRFGVEIDAWVAAWTLWIGRRRNRVLWASWVAEYPCLGGVDPVPGSEKRIDVRDDAEAIYALLCIGRSDPDAVTALMALLAPMWVHAKRRYLSLEAAELASAMLSENLGAPSTRSAPVRAIIKKACRTSDRSYWVANHDRPAAGDIDPVLANTADGAGDFVETLITRTVISQNIVTGSCLDLRIRGCSQAEINAHAGSPKKARTRTRTERDLLAAQLGWTSWTSRTGHTHPVPKQHVAA